MPLPPSRNRRAVQNKAMISSKTIWRRWQSVIVWALLLSLTSVWLPLWPGQQPGLAQQTNLPDDVVRLNELRQLRDQLQQTNSLRDSDIVIILSERTVIEALRQFIGLEITLSNGAGLRVTSVDAELKPAAALIKVGVQAKSSVTLNLELSGQMNGAQVMGDKLRLPYRVTDVQLQNNPFSALLLRTLFGGWLTPQNWNQELPPLEIPVAVGDALQIPAGRFDVDGSPPMEITTPAYQAPLQSAITSLFVLDQRVVLALRSAQLPVIAPAPVASSGALLSDLEKDADALTAEIARLSANLQSDSDVGVRLHRRLVAGLLTQIAGAQNPDLNLRLKPGRLRTEEVATVVKVTNYTDVESGEGRADVQQMQVEKIANGQLEMRLSVQGELDTKVRGREYGVPYSLSPHVTFALKEQMIPLQFVSENNRVLLRAVSGATLPLNLRFSLRPLGREVGINRTMLIQADRWLNRIEFPDLLQQELTLPRQLKAEKNGKLAVTERKPLRYALSNLRVTAQDDALQVAAGVSITPQ